MTEEKKSIWKEWAKAAAVRAVKTMAQTAVAMLPVGVSVTEVGWTAVIGTAVLAGILSLLTSIAGIPEADGGNSPLSERG